jgi:ADP-ribose pyrophosphatase YjhB (NUDIX family)
MDPRAAVAIEREVRAETALAAAIVQQLAMFCTNGEGRRRIRNFTFGLRRAEGGGREVAVVGF